MVAFFFTQFKKKVTNKDDTIGESKDYRAVRLINSFLRNCETRINPDNPINQFLT